ncbi:MAG TPA: shikimate dehydrogenase [Dongiaceae bacterium]|jgi:shikimate dehydrogenase|nr:shikimate dehydrogenase [Dongiaceae bacterium]
MYIPSASTRIAGVIGWPIAHSLSPRLHSFWLDRYGIDGLYLPMAVRPERITQAIAALQALGLQGCNVTLPHKVATMQAVDVLTERARRAGAVNTVTLDGHGKSLGDNTDGIGFLDHLRDHHPDWDGRAGPAILIGAGGAARAIAASLLDDVGVPELRLANRNAWRAKKLAQDLGGPITCVPWEKRHEALADVRLLVNTTMLGQAGQAPLHLDLARLPWEAVVYDIVYVPLETALLREARARGNPTIDGLGMLLHQAKIGFAAWFGCEPAIDEEVRRFVLAGLKAA